MLETDQVSAGLDTTFPALKKDADGSATVYFGPKPRARQEGNWIQTMPGKAWNVCTRLYGPLEAWYLEAWRRELNHRVRSRQESRTGPAARIGEPELPSIRLSRGEGLLAREKLYLEMQPSQAISFHQ